MLCRLAIALSSLVVTSIAFGAAAPGPYFDSIFYCGGVDLNLATSLAACETECTEKVDEFATQCGTVNGIFSYDTWECSCTLDAVDNKWICRGYKDVANELRPHARCDRP